MILPCIVLYFVFRWPTERVEVLVRYCLHNKLAGREVTLQNKRETTSHDKLEGHELSSRSFKENTVSTSLPTSCGKEDVNCDTKF